MEMQIVILNAASLCVFSASLFLVIKKTPERFRTDTATFLSCIIALLMFVNTSNILERLQITNIFDFFEDYAEMLFPLFFIMLLNSIRLHADIDRRKKTEAELDRMLRERSELLMEVHHRVKNNLQIVISILNLQRKQAETDETLDRILVDTENRIYSMAAVHEVMYNARHYSDIPATEFIRNITEKAAAGHAWRDSEKVQTVFNVDPAVCLRLEVAIPVGMLVNELVTNAYRHAFPPGRPGRLTLGLGIEKGTAVLEVRDNGVGIPGGISGNGHRGLGMLLLNNLATQIRGKLEYDGNGGTRIIVRFPV